MQISDVERTAQMFRGECTKSRGVCGQKDDQVVRLA